MIFKKLINLNKLDYFFLVLAIKPIDAAILVNNIITITISVIWVNCKPCSIGIKAVKPAVRPLETIKDTIITLST